MNHAGWCRELEIAKTGRQRCALWEGQAMRASKKMKLEGKQRERKKI